MAPLVLPEGGLSLRRDKPDARPSDPTSKPTQIMRLNLTQNTLDELVAGLRNDQKARVRLGKHQSLHYGNKSQSFCSTQESDRSEVYLSSSDSKENVYFSGILSHTLEVEKAREATAATDEALANLEQSMSAFEKGKESKKTPLITTIDQMKALGAGDNRTATGKEAASLARMSTSRIDVEKERFFKNAANRSTSASPALLAAHSPASHSAITPTSATVSQNKTKIRQDALRVPFIHLLAVRPVSAKFLAQKTCSSREDCLALTNKYCVENRLDREKFDLKDKVYKELDVWNFPYPSQEDRQSAIDNAISAFDRMRISRQDKLWQTLLPKHERGKGKVLSRLNLRTGPVAKNTAPRIQVQPSEEPAKAVDGVGNESDRVNNTTESASKAKSGSAAQKKRPLEKALNSKRPAASKPKNTTLTGRVTKKTDKKVEKKSSPKVDGKFKSAEYVHESDDEDTEMVDALPPESKDPGTTNKLPEKPTVSSLDRKATSTKNAASSSVSKSSAKSGAVKSSQTSKSIPSTNSTSRTTNGTSPQKPSPLGSSPPTNASDLDNSLQASNTPHSSSSSSPLMSQHSRQKAAAAAAAASVKSTTQQKARPPAKTNNTKQAPPSTTPLKRKAETAMGNPANQTVRQTKPRPSVTTATTNGYAPEPKRRRPSSPSSGSTTGSASPPITQGILRDRLVKKAERFKESYSKYRLLHEELSNHPDPPRDRVEDLKEQHEHLRRMKNEIWAEHHRLKR